jgi:hypothetical protein
LGVHCVKADLADGDRHVRTREASGPPNEGLA